MRDKGPAVEVAQKEQKLTLVQNAVQRKLEIRRLILLSFPTGSEA